MAEFLESSLFEDACHPERIKMIAAYESAFKANIVLHKAKAAFDAMAKAAPSLALQTWIVTESFAGVPPIARIDIHWKTKDGKREKESVVFHNDGRITLGAFSAQAGEPFFPQADTSNDRDAVAEKNNKVVEEILRFVAIDLLQYEPADALRSILESPAADDQAKPASP